MAHYVFITMIAHHLVIVAVKKYPIVLLIILHTNTFVIVQAAQVVYKQLVILQTVEL